MSDDEARRTADVVLDLPARPEFLAMARQVVAAAAALEPTFRDERIEDLRLAVSEATTNAVEAHAHLGSDERIKIRCNLADDRIEVQVLDQGGGFEPDETSEPPEPTDPDRLLWERGLGLPLMRELADESEIHSTDGGTTVRLVVYTPRRSWGL
jgi:serine/threonine-protein kinase RsbW